MKLKFLGEAELIEIPSLEVVYEKPMCIGAEAVILKSKFLGENSVIKLRIPKGYRRNEVDSLIRRRRTQVEANLMNRVKELGVRTPIVYYLDLEKCLLVLEYIKGILLREYLKLNPESWRKIAIEMGSAIGRMHEEDIVHGDLTTSNVFYSNSKLIFFDFGLGEFSKEVESKAVDIELLNRVFHSSHPEIHKRFMKVFLKSYIEAYRGGREVIDRFKKIRLMGRYVEREKRRG